MVIGGGAFSSSFVRRTRKASRRPCAASASKMASAADERQGIRSAVRSAAPLRPGPRRANLATAAPIEGTGDPEPEELRTMEASFATGDAKYNTEWPGALCPCAGRVGNMLVLHEHVGRDGLRELNCVAGPSWPSMFFITLPAIVGLSFVVANSLLCFEASGVRLVYWALTAWVCGCLLAVALTDPGVSRFYATPPPGCDSWPFSNQAKSFRPPNALFSRECNVVIEDFHHVCPWTGTAIGRKNARLFYSFLCSLSALLIFDLAAAVHSAAPEAGWAAAFGLLAGVALLGAALYGCLVRLVTAGGDGSIEVGYGAVLELPGYSMSSV